MSTMQFILLLLGSQICSASVDLVVSVLQYDNPSGTSYPSMNVTGNRKCCDTGTGSDDCGHTTDTCDVLFAFCLGVMDPTNACNGSYIDMTEDVLHDTNHFNVTQRKTLIRMSSMSWWDQDTVNLTANVFDIDHGNTTSGGVDSELVDFFTQPLSITPASNIAQAQDHIIMLQHTISLTLSIKVWCSAGWYGNLCEKQCNVSALDGYHECSKNGSLQPANTCLSKDLLVLTLQEKLLDALPLCNLQRKLTEFIAVSVCPRQTTDVNVTLNNINYKSFSPKDSDVDVLFYAYCNEVPVSRLKFTQTLFILNQYPLYSEFPANVFGAPVISPRISEIAFQKNQTKIYFLVRIVHYENKGINGCDMGHGGQTCSPMISICFHKSFCQTVTAFNSTTLTDCNGDLTDVSKTQQSTVNTPNSIILFPLPAYPESMLATIHNVTAGNGHVVTFNISLSYLSVRNYFSESFPVKYTETTKDMTLLLEIMAWCDEHYYGPQCSMKKPFLVRTFQPACSKNSECQNNGLCRDHQCICASGWTGATCTVDIDECSLGNCVNSQSCQNTNGSYTCSCKEGFSGKNCDQDVDECQRFPCHNGSTCLNTYGGYLCLCSPYWKGTFCNETDYCNQDICEHETTCSESNGNYTCVCEPGWTGRRCNYDINECLNNPCNNESSFDCVNSPGSYACRCKPGYIGTRCEHYNECKVFRPCQNGGRCYNVPGSHFCNCPPDWTGRNCTVPVVNCKQDPCHNNGTCLEVRGGSFKCNCAQGWTGQFCTQNIDECALFGGNKLCYFHGNCSDTQGGYTCTCNKGWTGQYCKTDLLECDTSPCYNNGTCTNLPGGYKCDCAQGWSGQTCREDIDECVALSPCQNSGTCININGSYECVCTEAWDGRNCTLDINECQSNKNICANNGTCHNTQGSFYCSCLTGWQGIHCTIDVDECTLYHPCLHSGTCINTGGSYDCRCITSWTGVNCTVNVNECSKYPHICVHGTCTDTIGGYNCSCSLGWQGQNCTDDVDECKNFDACSNYSICENTFNGYHCNCVDGWTGAKCDVDINECSSNPCQHGGTCIDRSAYYKCICPNGWDGLNCQTDINECNHNPCSDGQLCHNKPGSYSCVDLSTSTFGSTETTTRLLTTSSLSTFTTSLKTTKILSSSTTASRTPTVSTSSIPVSVDVFSLQFVSPVSQSDLPVVRDGIHNILKLLTCHDSSHIYVSLVHNSLTNPKTVEFHAQCDGHHLTNSEINSAIRTLSKEKLASYFPVALKDTDTTTKEESWISAHVPMVAGASAGVVVLIIIIIVSAIIYSKIKNKKYRKEEQTIVQAETLTDMDGKECVMIANPTYDSLYQKQTQA